MDVEFENAIRDGSMEGVEKVASSRTIDFGFNAFYYFRLACYEGKLETAKWIHSQRGVRDKKIYLECIKIAIEQGHNHIAKWLYSLKKVKIDTLFDHLCSI